MRNVLVKIGWTLLFLTSCAGNQPRALDEVRTGMDKDRVLDVVGNPKRTFRESMRDHWIYVYFQNKQEWRREIVFEDGKVSRIGRPLAKQDWLKDLENSDSMEEYEKKARDHQKKAGNFKSVDGQPDEPQAPEVKSP